MAYAMVLSKSTAGTATKAVFAGIGGDTIEVTGTGFKYDASGFLKAGTITKLRYIDYDFISPVLSQTISVTGLSAASLYKDLIAPASGLIDKISGWSTTDQIVSTTATRIVLDMDDFSKVVIKGSGFSQDPTKGTVTGLIHQDVNGHKIEEITGLKLSVAVAMTALGRSYDLYAYLTKGANTITNTTTFAPYLEGGLGDDTFKAGNSAFPTVEYIHTALAGIHADLGTGKVTGGAGNDTMVGIRSLSASNFSDVLIGSTPKTGNYSDSIHGNGGADKITGLGGDDNLYGGTGNDTIQGGTGNDTIDGGLGSDTLDGGAGAKDVIAFNVDRVGNTGIIFDLRKTGQQDLGDFGKDTVKGFEGVYGSVFDDKLVGTNGDNVMSGAGGADSVKGLGGNDMLYGDILPNYSAYGYAGNDILDGGAGNDTLSSFGGKDTLIGGTGKDTFVFVSLPSIYTGELADVIKDFNSADDVMNWSHFSFLGLSAGKLVADAFHLGTDAADAEDRFIYDKASGKLYYDSDGTGDNDQYLLLTMSNKATLAAADIVLT